MAKEDKEDENVKPKKARTRGDPVVELSDDSEE
jgi:hypothetical protein